MGQRFLGREQVVANAGVERGQQPVFVGRHRPRGEVAGGQLERVVQRFGDGVSELRDRSVDRAAQCDQPGHAGERHGVHSRKNGNLRELEGKLTQTIPICNIFLLCDRIRRRRR